MQLSRLSIYAVALIAFLSGSEMIYAAEKAWMHAGRIDVVDYKNGYLSVNDFSLRALATSKILSSSGKPLALHFVRKGVMVGVDYEIVPGVGQVITKMQLYSSGKKPRTDNED